MNTIDIHELSPNVEITSFEDTAMSLNLLFPEAVEEILESFTDYTDFDIIEELVNFLKLNITAVVEQKNKGIIIHGYITKGMLA